MGEASLRQVFAVLRARWLLVAVLALPVILMSWGYAATLPPSHTATVLLSFSPAPGTNLGASFVVLVPRYEIVATRRDSLDAAALTAGLPSGSLHDAVSADRPRSRLELTLRVTTPTEEASVAAASSLADVVTRAVDTDQLVSARTVGAPRSTGDEAPRRRIMVLVAGLLLAPLPGAALALTLEGIRPRVRLPEDLSGAGVTVLMSLPLRRRLVAPDVPGQRPAGGSARGKGQAGLALRPPLRLFLLILAGLDRDTARPSDSVTDVEVTAIDGHEEDADRVVQDLRRAAENLRPDLYPEPVHARFRRAPGLLVTSNTASRGGPPSRERFCVFVVRAGVPRDRVETAAELAVHQGVRVLGGVLLTR